MNKGEIRKIIREFLREDFSSWVIDKKQKAFSGASNFKKAIKRESRETLIAAKILAKLITKKEVSDYEIKFLKSQGADIGKAIALLGLQFIPGSSFGIIALEKILKNYGMTIFPKSQEEDSEPPNLY